jgi:hypothetical protein
MSLGLVDSGKGRMVILVPLAQPGTAGLLFVGLLFDMDQLALPARSRFQF